MNDFDKYLDHFEAYSNNDMNEKGKRKFVEKLGKNQEMRNDWDRYRAVMNALGDQEAINLRRKLDQISGDQT
jgi:hypothetical protein